MSLARALYESYGLGSTDSPWFATEISERLSLDSTNSGFTADIFRYGLEEFDLIVRQHRLGNISLFKARQKNELYIRGLVTHPNRLKVVSALIELNKSHRSYSAIDTNYYVAEFHLAAARSHRVSEVDTAPNESLIYNAIIGLGKAALVSHQIATIEPAA